MRTRDAVAGVLAVALAIGVAETLAGLLLAVPSPLDAVGQQVIEAAPGPVATAAIETFGAANRALVVAGVLVVAGLAGAGAGLVGRRAPAGAAGVVALGSAAGGLAATADPAASQVGTWVVVGAAAVVALGALRALLRRAPAAAGTAPTPGPTAPPHARREFLVAAGGVAAGAVALLAVGRVALAGRGRIVDPAAFPLPPPARSLGAPTPAQAWSAPVGLTPVLTPNERFFRIDTALRVPQVDPDTWTLRVHGRVEREVVLGYEDLLALALEEVDATIACVSNEVGGDLIGTARWTGVRLDAVLALAGVRADAEQVLSRSVDGFTAGFPVEVALDGRAALVAVGMNGEPLPTRHGFPARLVVPGLYGYVSATKWLAELELTSWEGVDGYWVPRGWAKQAPVKTGSRIDVPRPGGPVDAGPVVVAGVAWAPPHGVARVELRVDDGPWAATELATPLSDDTWVQWRATVELAPGEHQLAVRAVAGDGEPQPAGPRPPAPDGAEGWHTVRVRAR